MFQTRRWLCRSLSTLSSNPIRVCVVGSGPVGFYTSEKMLKTRKDAEVDIIDRLPTLFDLVRSSVAPDHPKTKFSRVAQNEHCKFFGNVALGSFVSLKEGNVALDARILLQSTTVLATIDIANHAFESLEQNSIRRVYLVGRRWPAQAACTTKELCEVFGIKKMCIFLTEVDLVKSPEDEVQGQGNIVVGTGQFGDLECGLVLKSIGYKSVPFDGLTFNHRKGVVPNIGGPVLADTSGLNDKCYIIAIIPVGPRFSHSHTYHRYPELCWVPIPIFSNPSTPCTTLS